jgi:hypothetical protein
MNVDFEVAAFLLDALGLRNIVMLDPRAINFLFQIISLLRLLELSLLASQGCTLSISRHTARQMPALPPVLPKPVEWFPDGN